VDRTGINRRPGATRSARELSAHLEARVRLRRRLFGFRSGVVADCQAVSDRGCRSFLPRLCSLLRVSDASSDLFHATPLSLPPPFISSLVDTSCRWLFLVLLQIASAIFSLRLRLPVFSLPFSVSSASARWLDYRSSGAQLLSLFAFYVDQCGYYEPDLPGWSRVFILGRNKSYYLGTYLYVSLYENNHYGSNPSKYVLSFHFFQDNSRIYDCKVFISTFLMISIVMSDDIVDVTLFFTTGLFY